MTEQKLEKEVLVEEQAAEEIPAAVEEVKEEAAEKAGQQAEKKEESIKGIIKSEKGRETTWIPKTQLGKDIVSGKYTDIMQVLDSGRLILEPEITDYLVPNLKQEIVYIGGSPGKGGGIKRTATRITARMHKSGRRYNSSSLVVVGNENGVIGIGKASSKEHRQAIEKSVAQAKLNIVKVKRGCGSWECFCGTSHSLPFRVSAKYGSVTVTLNPGPKGIGIVASEEARKMLKLAGIKDVWVSSEGQTATRINLAFAIFNALKNLSRVKGDI